MYRTYGLAWLQIDLHCKFKFHSIFDSIPADLRKQYQIFKYIEYQMDEENKKRNRASLSASRQLR